jgi:hypothetical protein
MSAATSPPQCAITGCSNPASRLLKESALVNLRASLGVRVPAGSEVWCCYQCRGTFSNQVNQRALETQYCVCGTHKKAREMDAAALRDEDKPFIVLKHPSCSAICKACRKTAKAVKQKVKRAHDTLMTHAPESTRPTPSQPAASRAESILRRQLDQKTFENKLLKENLDSLKHTVRSALGMHASAKGFEKGERTSRQNFTEIVVTQLELLCGPPGGYDLNETLAKRPWVDIEAALMHVLKHKRGVMV